MARPLRGGGVIRALQLRKKTFFEARKKIQEARGVGGKSLVAGQLKKTFFAASLIKGSKRQKMTYLF